MRHAHRAQKARFQHGLQFPNGYAFRGAQRDNSRGVDQRVRRARESVCFFAESFNALLVGDIQKKPVALIPFAFAAGKGTRAADHQPARVLKRRRQALAQTA